MTTLADAASAQALAEQVLQARLAACATQLAPVESRYHWQGRIETAQEIAVLFKTSAARALDLERFIAEHHPYDTPEILSWCASASPAYAQWAGAETHKTTYV